MDATAVSGAWKRKLWLGAALVALGGLCYGYFPLSPLFSLLLPLAVCPLYQRGELWPALLLPLIPAAAFLARGGDMGIGLLLPLYSCLGLLLVVIGKRRRWGLHAEAAVLIAACAVTSLALLTRLSLLLGGPLYTSLSESVIGTLQNSLMRGSILYRLTSLGILSVPSAYAGSTAFQLGDYVLMNPGLEKELLNMLRLRLSEGLTSWIPSLLVHSSALIGLFSALFAARASARRAGDVSQAPRFRDLRLTKTEQGYMLLLCVVTLFTGFIDDAFLSQLSALTYAAFAAICQLLGAAVLVTLLSKRHPERAGLYGFLAGLLYLVFPLVLFLLGMLDQFLPLRPETPNHQEEE